MRRLQNSPYWSEMHFVWSERGDWEEITLSSIRFSSREFQDKKTTVLQSAIVGARAWLVMFVASNVFRIVDRKELSAVISSALNQYVQ